MPPGWGGGVETERFQHSASTHSGAGEKETLNINLERIRTTRKRVVICGQRPVNKSMNPRIEAHH